MIRPHVFGAVLAIVLIATGVASRVAGQDVETRPAAEPSEPGAVMTVSPTEATVGDHLAATLVLRLEDGQRFDPRTLGRDLGPFTVVGGEWAETEASASGRGATWTWSGVLATYETGERELPPVRLRVSRGDEEVIVATEPVVVSVQSVLEADGDPASLSPADLKAPASIEPDYGPLLGALVAIGAVLLAAGAFWWLHRRFRSRLEAVEQPVDPFRRLPPHVWVYEELKKLLALRLAEEGRVDEFFAALSHIVKQYLSGRYRVDLMEHTTEELPWLLGQAGAPGEVATAARDLLHRCDLVKFAGSEPGMDGVRSAVEEAYRIVDISRPPGEEEWPTAKGAA